MSATTLFRLGLACTLQLAAAGGAGAAVFALPDAGEDLIGRSSWTVAQPGDNLAVIAYRHALGFRELIHANPGVDPWNLQPQQKILLPTARLLPPGPRRGMVVNVPEMRLYYYPEDGTRVFSFPVAVGRLDWKTPLGETSVLSKVRDPVWYPPESIRAEHAAKGDPLPAAVPPGPDNPLGHRALRLGWAQILIHGTNMPLGGIGMPVTHGCIRLYPQDIETLFDEATIGTPVRFIDEPYKLGRSRGRWYLEAHAALSVDPHATNAGADLEPMLVKVKSQTSIVARPAQLDRDRVLKTLQQSAGTPVLIEAEPVPAVSAAPAASTVPRVQPENRAVPWGAARSFTTLAVPMPLLLLGLLVLLALLAAGRIRRRLGLHRRQIGRT